MPETYGNPIKGYNVENTIHKVDYEALANKPFGDKTEITLFSCDALPFEDDQQGHDPTTYVFEDHSGSVDTSIYGTSQSPWFADGAMLIVIWDGVEYHLPLTQNPYLEYVGINVKNLTQDYDLMQYDEEDPPFAITFYGILDESYAGIEDIVTHDAGATHSLVIKYTATSEIPNNYYSPNIARQFNVQTEKIGIFTHTHSNID